DWLNPRQGYLVSARTRARVQRWFRQRDYDRNVVDGRRLLERVLRRQSKPDSVKLEHLAQRSRFPQPNDFLAAIGRGALTLAQFAPTPQPPAPAPREASPERAPASESAPIIVGGMDNLQTRIAGCCQPTVDDAIVGFITRNYGLSIHRRDCHNITRLDDIERQRLFDAQWAPRSRPGTRIDRHRLCRQILPLKRPRRGCCPPLARRNPLAEHPYSSLLRPHLIALAVDVNKAGLLVVLFGFHPRQPAAEGFGLYILRRALLVGDHPGNRAEANRQDVFPFSRAVMV